MHLYGVQLSFAASSLVGRASVRVYDVGQKGLTHNLCCSSSLLHQTQHLAECSQAGGVLLAFTKPRLLLQTAREGSLIHHTTE